MYALVEGVQQYKKNGDFRSDRADLRHILEMGVMGG